MIRLLIVRRSLGTALMVCLIATALAAATKPPQGANAPSDDAAQITITYPAAPGRPTQVTLPKGGSFTVALPSNPTTGYSWKLDGALNPKILKTDGGKYIAPAQTNPPIVGRGGREVWTFTAVGPGKQTVTLIYVRPWEKNVAPVKTQKMWVTVQ